MDRAQHPFDRAWMEIDLGVIGRNFQEVARELGGEEHIIAVVKADAYGLGAVPLAERVPLAAAQGFEVPAVCLPQARELWRVAAEAGVTLRIQLKLDSGLGRLG